ncbi:MAG: hypothetical protein IJR28_03860 [Ottowia sp.]|nr:hypothetical protein [Ottowia sp.]
MQNINNKQRLTRQDFFKGLATLLALLLAAFFSMGFHTLARAHGLEISRPLWQWYFPCCCGFVIFFSPSIRPQAQKKTTSFAPGWFVPASIIAAFLVLLVVTEYEARWRGVDIHQPPPATRPATP